MFQRCGGLSGTIRMISAQASQTHDSRNRSNKNDLCKRMNDLCKRMSDLCKRDRVGRDYLAVRRVVTISNP